MVPHPFLAGALSIVLSMVVAPPAHAAEQMQETRRIEVLDRLDPRDRLFRPISPDAAALAAHSGRMLHIIKITPNQADPAFRQLLERLVTQCSTQRNATSNNLTIYALASASSTDTMVRQYMVEFAPLAATERKGCYLSPLCKGEACLAVSFNNEQGRWVAQEKLYVKDVEVVDEDRTLQPIPLFMFDAEGEACTQWSASAGSPDESRCRAHYRWNLTGLKRAEQ